MGRAMSNWKSLPPSGGIHSVLNSEFGAQDRPDRIVYPDLNDGSDLVLATDYSGEHDAPYRRASVHCNCNGRLNERNAAPRSFVHMFVFIFFV